MSSRSTVRLPYRTFWRRFWAGLVDNLLVATPLVALEFWIERHWASPIASAACLTCLAAAGPAYSILLHGRFGQTLGKRLLRVKVIDLSGARLTMGQAVRRELINLPFALWSYVALMVDVSHGGSAFRPAHPDYGPPAALSYALLGLELLSTLLSSKRRAVHDLVAGSVVVRVSAAQAPTDDPQPAEADGSDTLVTQRRTAAEI